MSIEFSVVLSSLGVCLAIFLVTVLFGVWAESRARSVFRKYATRGMEHPTSGAEAATAICRAGRANVVVQREGKFLTVYYDPSAKALLLSAETYDGRSITSIAKGIYEAGHALQDIQRYPWFGLRSGVVPLDNFVTRYWYWAMITGAYLLLPYREGRVDFAGALRPTFHMAGAGIVLVAMLFFVGLVLRQLAGLVVGRDASSRARAVLARAGIDSTDAELESLSKVLDAAPLFYVGMALKAFAIIDGRDTQPISTNDRSGRGDFF